MVDNKGDYLEESLRIVKEFNQLRFKDGRLLSSFFKVGGYETWWFEQEYLFWYLIVPYVKNRDRFNELFATKSVDSIKAENITNIWKNLIQDEEYFATKKHSTGNEKSRKPNKLLIWGHLLALIGLSFISSLIFRLSGRDTLLYIIDDVAPDLDHDYRLTTLYRELRRRQYKFCEYAHTWGAENYYRRTWQNLWRRKRPVVYFEILARRLGKLKQWLDKNAVGSFPEIEIDISNLEGRYLQATAHYMLRWSQDLAYEVRVLKNLLKAQQVKRAVIADNARHVFPLIVACKLLNIPTLGFMHGLFNRYHCSIMAYGLNNGRRPNLDLYGLWSSYFRERAISGNLYDESNTFVTGPLRPPAKDQIEMVLSASKNNHEKIRVLLVSEPRAPQKEVFEYIAELLADDRFEVMIKVRPGEMNPHLSDTVGGETKSLKVIRTGTVYDSFVNCDVLLGTYSTVLYEAAYVLKPAVILKTSFSYGHDLAYDGLADFAESPEHICEIVVRSSLLSERELVRRRERIWESEMKDGAATLFDYAESKNFFQPSSS